LSSSILSHAPFDVSDASLQCWQKHATRLNCNAHNKPVCCATFAWLRQCLATRNAAPAKHAELHWCLMMANSQGTALQYAVDTVTACRALSQAALLHLAWLGANQVVSCLAASAAQQLHYFQVGMCPSFGIATGTAVLPVSCQGSACSKSIWDSLLQRDLLILQLGLKSLALCHVEDCD